MIDVSAGGVDARAIMIRGFLLAIGVLRAVFLSDVNRWASRQLWITTDGNRLDSFHLAEHSWRVVSNDHM